MKIWYVDCDDLSCAWTKKEDAIKYFEAEAKNCNWEYKYQYKEALLDNDMFVTARVKCVYEEAEEIFYVDIYSIFLDEKPYWTIE